MKPSAKSEICKKTKKEKPTGKKDGYLVFEKKSIFRQDENCKDLVVNDGQHPR